ncbi:hypothetical protein BC939DRAFT_462425 [Gamsiella multidivaricata]|uniref:uncharacterized protein n=1 Tax=Gamsiella multidivaricata TaxID=101098 RepID=UPI00221EC8BD|nr:uncharacterized protein BC939DRAFT_462425 [Gamsiella multidivaricata]KAI7818660.1 hypothetical protein BC939DRAFT_462425 [Gamsiella multidivaricata]
MISDLILVTPFDTTDPKFLLRDDTPFTTRVQTSSLLLLWSSLGSLTSAPFFISLPRWVFSSFLSFVLFLSLSPLISMGLFCLPPFPVLFFSCPIESWSVFTVTAECATKIKVKSCTSNRGVKRGVNGSASLGDSIWMRNAVTYLGRAPLTLPRQGLGWQRRMR